MAASKLDLVKMVIDAGPVMYVIGALSVWAIGIAIERAIVLTIEKIKMSPAKLINIFGKTLEKNNGDRMKTVEEMTPLLKKKANACSEIVLAAFHKFVDGTNKDLKPMELKRWMQDSYEARANSEIPSLEANLLWLAVIANVATLVGLAGTVLGMIESFSAMSKSAGGVKADEMAGGIATALIATLGGLMVAIPSLMLYNLLKSQVEGIVAQIEETTVTIVDTLSE